MTDNTESKKDKRLQNLRPPWKPGESGNLKGRKKNRVVNEWLPQCFGHKRAKQIKALSQEEIDMWEQLLMYLSHPELSVIAKWDDSPAYAKNIAMSILFDIKNGKTTTIDKLRERQYGKPIQRIELTGKDGSNLLGKGVSIEEAKQIINDLESGY